MITESTVFDPFNRSLGSGFVLQSLRDRNDVERVAAFNGLIHSPSAAEMTRSLILHHPHTRPEHWLYIEEESTGKIISSLCLIPWLWRHEDVMLKCGEMGLVGTLESYRNRGLVRALITRFKELLRDGDYDLSHIQGIPYFYRQFGYEYAIPLEANWHVELHNLPGEPTEATAGYQFRPASLDDIPAMMRMYDEAAHILDICTVRDADTWRYMMEDTQGSELEGEFWIVQNLAGKPIGYWRITLHGFGKGLIVNEVSQLSHAAAQAILLKLKSQAHERGKPDIRLNLSASSTLVNAARGWNAFDQGTYSWQIHLVDVARLMSKLTPIFERRIVSSAFAGLSKHIVINLYREAFDLHFDSGRLLAVNAIGFCNEGELRIPPLLLAPLLLGYRSREELAHMYPDVACWGKSQYLVDILFPKLESFIFMNY